MSLNKGQPGEHDAFFRDPTHAMLNCLLLFVRHLKMELLMQFPASKKKHIFILMKN